MSKVKKFVLIPLLMCLFLSACDEGGIGVKVNKDEYEQETNIQDELTNDEDNTNTNSGATGTNDEDNATDGENPTIPIPGGETTEPVTPTIDLDSKITSFNSTFVKVDDDKYVYVQIDQSPFSDVYDFAYYTVNEAKLEQSTFYKVEVIDETETYKLYIGDVSSGKYVIKFYNKEGKQYGKSDIRVKVANVDYTNSYVAVSFNLIQMRFISFGFSVQNFFKKIGDFFNNLFSQDKLSY